MKAHISFVGHLRPMPALISPGGQACVCMKSRVIKITNVKVSSEFCFHIMFWPGGTVQCKERQRDKHEARIYSTCCSPRWPRAAFTLETLESVCVSSQTLIDSYICDQ